MKYAAICLLIAMCAFSRAIELPAGLRPAKAINEPQKPIVPGDETAALANVRTPPNLLLRSRMLAALNSNDTPDSPGVVKTAGNNDDEVQTTSSAQKPPVVFQKSGRKSKKTNTQSAAVQHVSAGAVETAAKKPERIAIAPPKGKNYGVNTLLQTNLVDSKGRVIKGVNSVPIRVPSSSELRNAKTSRASASQVETDAEKVVPIQFGRADRHK